jgi:hypothetical protein
MSVHRLVGDEKGAWTDIFMKQSMKMTVHRIVSEAAQKVGNHAFRLAKNS